MDDKILAKENAYLQKTLAVLQDNLDDVESKRSAMAEGMVAHRREIWENVGQMDELEQAGEETAAELNSDRYVMLTKLKDRIERQLYSPYFGKVDFGTAPDKRVGVYVGLAQASDDEGNTYVVDWRAPVADLYYNHDLGDASYVAPMGKIAGKIYNKYQFKIEEGRMRYMVDTSTTILDEVLLAELGKNASPLMRNIAATIQREQNRVIRHSFGDNILVHGVAGSGKTSIALHRIAYILYHSRQTIRAKDVWIITPNKAFTAYIGNVLPELGEEMVPQHSLDDLVAAELRKVCLFESRQDHLEAVYDGVKQQEDKIADMRYKSSLAFVADIEAFAKKLDHICFRPKDFAAGQYVCEKDTIRTLFYKRYAAYPAEVRIRKIADYIERELSAYYHLRATSVLRIRIREMVQSMYTRYDILSLYRRLLRDLQAGGAPVMLFDKEGAVPYEDVMGLTYLKCLVEGSEIRAQNVKHLVVDEMQDYTPVAYAYLNRLFPCRKTVLGDVGQTADPFLNVGDLDTARRLLGGEECVLYALETSYRSSYEIAIFANRFANTPILPVDRHGDAPLVRKVAQDDLPNALREQLAEAGKRGYASVAIIARTGEEARLLRKQLSGGVGAKLLLDAQTAFTGGVVITTAFVVKGFEFDQVILPDVSSERYCRPWDKQLLYISATRALHRLCIFHTGAPSEFLQASDK